MGAPTSRTFAFSVFVFNSQTGELLRSGRRVRIPDQAAKLLAALVEKPGEMVTRQELRERLWPEGEVLDYDHSINRAVSLLRYTLRDRSNKLDVIETLPKRGYRFSAPVTEMHPPSDLAYSGDAVPHSELALTIPSPPEPEKESDSVLNPKPPAESQLTVEEAAMPSAEIHTTAKPTWLARLRSWRAMILTAAALALVIAAGFAYWHHRNAATTLTLAIVPFETSGEGAAALADSFRLDLADTLSQMPTIEIRAVHSFEHLGQDESKIESEARQLGVDALLFGKLSVNSGDCELRLELVRRSDGVHIGSFQYSGRKEELAAIRDRFERDLFQRLHPSSGSNSLAQAPTPSPSAYAAYLRGRSYLAQWTDESLLQAIASFQEALKQEPNYARADAGIASAYFVLAQHGADDPAQSMEKSRQYATRALQIDPSLAEGYAMLGQVALIKDWNFNEAERQLRHATEIDPNHAIYHQWFAILFCTEGKYEQALGEIDKAHAADRDWAPPYMTEIYVAASAHNYDRANRAAALLLQRMPDWPLAHEQNASSLWEQGRNLEAIEEFRQAAILSKDSEKAQLEVRGAEAFRKGGAVAYARLRLEAIALHQGEGPGEKNSSPALWHAYAGDWNQTLDDLETMVNTHSPEALQIAAAPAYEPLHNNPRFQALLSKVGVKASSASR